MFSSKRRKRRHPNWPYRWTLLGLVLLVAAYIGLQTLIGLSGLGVRGYRFDLQLAFVGSLLDGTIATWFFAVGASIGSFLNVVAYRLPLGRNVRGHSSCPYCCTPIRGLDNIPVLAWIKLRGRCRACRLPISIQYPLVELAVGIVFFVVFLSEFRSGGSNLPSDAPASAMRHMMFRLGLSAEVILRLVSYVFLLSGLIAAALIAVRRKAVPMSLYLWSIGPLLVLALYDPNIIIVRWRAAEAVGFLETRMDAITTLLCGVVAGVAMARVIAPLIYPGFDRSLMSFDSASTGARQFSGAMGVAGAILGWQYVVLLAWFVLLIAMLAAGWLKRWFPRVWLRDLTLWVWLGLLALRASWSFWAAVDLPSTIPPVMIYVAGALLLAPLCIFYVQLTPEVAVTSEVKSQEEEEEDEWEEERDA